jgi:hypothetical protein
VSRVGRSVTFSTNWRAYGRAPGAHPSICRQNASEMPVSKTVMGHFGPSRVRIPPPPLAAPIRITKPDRATRAHGCRFMDHKSGERNLRQRRRIGARSRPLTAALSTSPADAGGHTREESTVIRREQTTAPARSATRRLGSAASPRSTAVTPSDSQRPRLRVERSDPSAAALRPERGGPRFWSPSDGRAVLGFAHCNSGVAKSSAARSGRRPR